MLGWMGRVQLPAHAFAAFETQLNDLQLTAEEPAHLYFETIEGAPLITGSDGSTVEPTLYAFYPDRDGMEVGVILHLADGRISWLERIRATGEPPFEKNPLSVDALFYRDPRRW